MRDSGEGLHQVSRAILVKRPAALPSGKPSDPVVGFDETMVPQADGSAVEGNPIFVTQQAGSRHHLEREYIYIYFMLLGFSLLVLLSIQNIIGL